MSSVIVTHDSLHRNYYIHCTYIFSDNSQCNLHQINGGEEEAEVVGNSATIYFEGTGPSVDNVVRDYDIRIEERQADGEFVRLGDIFQCSDTSSAPISVQCSVETGGTHIILLLPQTLIP